MSVRDLSLFRIGEDWLGVWTGRSVPGVAGETSGVCRPDTRRDLSRVSELARPGGMIPLNLDLPGAAAHLLRGVPSLHPQKHFHIHPKRLLDAQGHFRRKRGAALEKVRQGSAANAKHIRCLGHTQTQLVQNFMANKFSGVMNAFSSPPEKIASYCVTSSPRQSLRCILSFGMWEVYRRFQRQSCAPCQM